MPLINWNDSYSVHNSKIDEQHKKWIGIINKMHRSMMNDSQSACKLEFKESLKEMVDYTRYHLAFEEKLLLSINYPGLDEHAMKHRELKKKIKETIDTLRSGDMVRLSSFLKMAKHWLLDHIMTEDQKYSPYVSTEIDGKEQKRAENHTKDQSCV